MFTIMIKFVFFLLMVSIGSADNNANYYQTLRNNVISTLNSARNESQIDVFEDFKKLNNIFNVDIILDSMKLFKDELDNDLSNNVNIDMELDDPKATKTRTEFGFSITSTNIQTTDTSEYQSDNTKTHETSTGMNTVLPPSPYVKVSPLCLNHSMSVLTGILERKSWALQSKW